MLKIKDSNDRLITLFQSGYSRLEDEHNGSVRTWALIGVWFSLVSFLVPFIAFATNSVFEEKLSECNSFMKFRVITLWIIIICSVVGGVIGTHAKNHHLVLQYVVVGSLFCMYINLNVILNVWNVEPIQSFSPIVIYVFVWQVLEIFALSVLYKYVEQIEENIIRSNVSFL